MTHLEGYRKEHDVPGGLPPSVSPLLHPCMNGGLLLGQVLQLLLVVVTSPPEYRVPHPGEEALPRGGRRRRILPAGGPRRVPVPSRLLRHHLKPETERKRPRSITPSLNGN